MKILITLGLALLISSNLFAQDEKHTNYYKTVDSIDIEAEDYKIAYNNVVAKMDYSKLQIELENLTSDYLLIKKEESAFDIDGNQFFPEEKWLFINPNKTIKRTLKVEGATNYHVDNFSVTPSIYKFKADGNTIEAPNFELPASANEIKFGDFIVKLKGLKKKTKETVATFEVTYNGDDIALVDASQLAVTIPDKGDKFFANNNKLATTKILVKGDKKTIKAAFKVSAKYADMQFANMEIVWRKTFQTSKPQKLTGITTSFEVDKGLTAGKN